MSPQQNNNQQPTGSGNPDWELQPGPDDESDHRPAPQPINNAKPAGRRRQPSGNGAARAIEHWLNGLLLVSALVFGLAWLQRDRLPPPEEILPELAQAPVQTPLEYPPFQFSYRKHDYQVKTFAEYELWGIIVSHNNISGIGDIYHTSDSLDTKDICVLWGGNVARSDYLRTQFSSGAWTCYYEYPQGVSLNTAEVSNNHLITDSDKLRQTIADLRRGDQIHFRGRLVGYRDMQMPANFWRNSSLIRTDTGNGACEVVFVENIEVLKPGNQNWRKTYRIAGWVGLIALAIRSLFFLAYLFKPSDERLTRFTWKK